MAKLIPLKAEPLMFKANWGETSVTHQLPQGMVEQMLAFAYPDKKLLSYELISGGCANLNIKILLEDNKYPLILRVYLRDKDAAYKVSSVLDWEFSFSGSVLWDVANMLRYAHKMPHEFQDAFLKGLTNGGITLPENWRITIQLLNLVSLLDCLKRSHHNYRPNQCTAIRKLIDHILSTLHAMGTNET